MISEYTLKARIYPAVLTSLPVILLVNLVFDTQTRVWLGSDDLAALFGKGTLGLAVVFLLAQTGRFFGAEVFERLHFKDETAFPSTRLLLPGCNELSDQLRQLVTEKIKKDFKLQLPDIVQDGEEQAIRRLITDAVRRMRERVGKHKLLLQHNIEYGFFRNLIGAGPMTLAASLGNIYLFNTGTAGTGVFKASIAFAATSILLMVSSGFVMNRLGTRYARVLFQSYLEAK